MCCVPCGVFGCSSVLSSGSCSVGRVFPLEQWRQDVSSDWTSLPVMHATEASPGRQRYIQRSAEESLAFTHSSRSLWCEVMGDAFCLQPGLAWTPSLPRGLLDDGSRQSCCPVALPSGPDHNPVRIYHDNRVPCSVPEIPVYDRRHQPRRWMAHDSSLRR